MDAHYISFWHMAFASTRELSCDILKCLWNFLNRHERAMLIHGHCTMNWKWTILETCIPWWRHQMETFSVVLAICAGNPPATGEFPAQRPVTQSFDVFFDLRLNKRLSKQSWGWWFETPSLSLWRHCNALCPWRSSIIIFSCQWFKR